MLLNKHRFALLVALATVSLPLAAQAQRVSPLRDAPAIRKRFELRSSRLELGAGAGTTINQDFYHTVLINARLAYHITDWVAIAGSATSASRRSRPASRARSSTRWTTRR